MEKPQTVGDMTVSQLENLIQNVVRQEMEAHPTRTEVAQLIQQRVIDATQSEQTRYKAYVKGEIKSASDRTETRLSAQWSEFRKGLEAMQKSLELIPELHTTVAGLSGQQQSISIALQATIEQSLEAQRKTRDLSDELARVQSESAFRDDLERDREHRFEQLKHLITGDEHQIGITGEMRKLSQSFEAMTVNLATTQASIKTDIIGMQRKVDAVYVPARAFWRVVSARQFWLVVAGIVATVAGLEIGDVIQLFGG